MKRTLVFMVSLFLVVGISLGAAAQVNTNIPPPPPLEFPAPPDVVVVPSEQTDVYLVPRTVGLYFCNGFWYRFNEGYWYRAPAGIFAGLIAPWTPIYETRVPIPVLVIPPDYILSLPPGYHLIPHSEFARHWMDWGRNHYWRTQPWYREHAEHHWGGREFQRPPAGVRPKVGVERGVKAAGKPAGAGPKVAVEKGPRGGGSGAGKPAGAGPKAAVEKEPRSGGTSAGKPAGEYPKAGHPEKRE